MNTPDQASDTAINRLVDLENGYKPAPINAVVPEFSTQKPSEDHPLAAWIFKAYKRDTAIICKADAYRIGNELNRLLSRVEELEQRLGLPVPSGQLFEEDYSDEDQ